MNAVTISIKNGYTIIATFSYYNEAIQVSSQKWIIQLTPIRATCTEFPYIMTIQCKSTNTVIIMITTSSWLLEDTVTSWGLAK